MYDQNYLYFKINFSKIKKKFCKNNQHLPEPLPPICHPMSAFAKPPSSPLVAEKFVNGPFLQLRKSHPSQLFIKACPNT